MGRGKKVATEGELHSIIRTAPLLAERDDGKKEGEEPGVFLNPGEERHPCGEEDWQTEKKPAGEGGARSF